MRQPVNLTRKSLNEARASVATKSYKCARCSAAQVRKTYRKNVVRGRAIAAKSRYGPNCPALRAGGLRRTSH